MKYKTQLHKINAFITLITNIQIVERDKVSRERERERELKAVAVGGHFAVVRSAGDTRR